MTGQTLIRKPAAFLLAALILAAQAIAGQPVAAQPFGDHQQRLKLDIDDFAPRVVHADTEAITLTGSITNIGDRRITDLAARLELGQRAASERALTNALNEPLPAYPQASQFVTLDGPLQPGQTTRLHLQVPLGGPGGLEIPQRGVYPLLVNVNGTPDYGGPARLIAATLLLPVLGVPGGAGDQDDKSRPPTGVSVLWPITAERPKVVRTPYRQPIVLADDSLADQLRAGGRLHGLVSAAASARDSGRISGALCYVLDPALVATAQAMAGGYQVRTPGGPVPGAGVEAAKQWLESLRQLVEGQCVIRMPYADASLNALTKIGGTGQGGAELSAIATSGEQLIQEVLGVRPLPGVLWPGGTLGGAALEATAANGVRTVITDADRFPGSAQPRAGAPIADSELRAQPFDPLLRRALTGGSTTGAAADLSVQNGLGALVFRHRENAGEGPLLLAPPRRWDASPSELSAFVRLLGDFADTGMINPVPLQQQLAAAPAGTPVTLTDDAAPDEATRGVPSSALSTLSEIDATATDLASAMTVDPATQVPPNALIRPLRAGVLRASSTAWAGDPAGRAAAVRAAQAQVDAIAGQVTVTPPPQPISLASGESPLPVYISNTLPVTITVRVSLLNRAGLRPSPIPDQTIPASSARNRYIEIEALRAGRIGIEVKLSTPGGTQLGEIASFELTSTEYGVFTIVITSTAAAALLLLSGRRILRRVRRRRTG